MGRGKRIRSTYVPVRLGDSDTRTFLPPAPSPREILGRRYRALGEDVQLRPHERGLMSTMHAFIVDKSDLMVAEGWLDELETHNSRQRIALLNHEHERITGEHKSLEIVHLLDSGMTVVRADDAADCASFCADLDRPYEAFDLSEDEVYFLRDTGMCFAIVIGFTARDASGRPEAFLVERIRGRFPGSDEPGWDQDNLDDAETPLTEWFEHLRREGIDAYWGEGEEHVTDDFVELSAFYFHDFREAPRRYFDGLDERFGLAGPVSRINNSVTVEACLDACASGKYLEASDYADKLADAVYVATCLAGGDTAELMTRAAVWVAARRKGCASEEEWLERYEPVIDFSERLHAVDEFVGGDSAVLAGGLPWRL